MIKFKFVFQFRPQKRYREISINVLLELEKTKIDSWIAGSQINLFLIRFLKWSFTSIGLTTLFSVVPLIIQGGGGGGEEGSVFQSNDDMTILDGNRNWNKWTWDCVAAKQNCSRRGENMSLVKNEDRSDGFRCECRKQGGGIEVYILVVSRFESMAN